MIEQEHTEFEEGFKVNWTAKENARKLLEQEKMFKEIGVEIL